MRREQLAVQRLEAHALAGSDAAPAEEIAAELGGDRRAVEPNIDLRLGAGDADRMDRRLAILGRLDIDVMRANEQGCGAVAIAVDDVAADGAGIDTGHLDAPGLDAARERALWSERVEALQALVGFEGTRRWLAANGEQYDGVLVQVN